MTKDLTTFNNSRTSKIVLILSVLVSGFWGLGQVINVYRFALVGAIFELLWLPMLAMIFILPIMSLRFLVKEQFNVRSLYLYSILIVVATILLMVFSK